MKLYFKYLLALPVLCLGPLALADEVLEEIVVTAGLRDTVLMKSAGSISVVSEQTIIDRAARHFEDTINTLPNGSHFADHEACKALFRECRQNCKTQVAVAVHRPVNLLARLVTAYVHDSDLSGVVADELSQQLDGLFLFAVLQREFPEVFDIESQPFV